MKKKDYVAMKIMDIIQEGNIGLIKAIEKFDINKGCKFSTHAVWWIRQSITRAIDDKERCIRIPVYVYDNERKIKKAMGNFLQRYDRLPNVEELSLETGLSIKSVQDVVNNVTDIYSLNETIKCDGEDSYDEVKIDYIENPNFSLENDVLDGVWKDELKDVINNLLNSDLLKDGEREVIIKRFGLDGSKGGSLRKVAKDLGITHEAIRLRENKAFRKLRMNSRVRKVARGVVLN